jgi:hypothetical protein
MDNRVRITMFTISFKWASVLASAIARLYTYIQPSPSKSKEFSTVFPDKEG